MRTVQVETQSMGSFNKIKKRVTMGLLFLGKVPKALQNITKRIDLEQYFRRYKIIDAPCFLLPKHPFLLELLSNDK